MCVIYLAWKTDPDRPLVVAANRDEFYRRPTADAHRWTDHPEIFAGRDLEQGGTWLGVSVRGRFAAVTNYRDPAAPTGKRSRGALVRDLLLSDERPSEFMMKIRGVSDEYSGFNLLGADANELAYFSNRDGEVRLLAAGIYGLSNHLLDSPWPKVRSGRARFGDLIARRDANPDNYFGVLSDKSLAPDEELPDTGVGREREKLLSAIFIETPVYGTRSSAVVFADRDFRLTLVERTFV